MAEIPASDIRAEAHRLIDNLPEQATWDDLVYRIYVRQCIDDGIRDADAGRVVDIDEVRRRVRLTQ